MAAADRPETAHPRQQCNPQPNPAPADPIEKLTPASDGKYYHIIQSGETLSWIADLYKVKVTDLMAWNGLNASSILQPKQKLLLQVTPPATQTPTPGPATATPSATAVPPTATATLGITRTALSPTAAVETSPAMDRTQIFWLILLGLAAGGMFLVVFFSRKK